MNKERILFILKFRQGYDDKPQYSNGKYFSSGLYWSAKFVSDMLAESGITTKLVQVIDNNDIDREVAQFKPTIVIIEALWIVPEKFDILKKLHPTVQWIVRLHSNLPFLAQEGIACKWIKGYAARGVRIAANEWQAVKDVSIVAGTAVIYLPNYYPLQTAIATPSTNGRLNVACYGAVRPLKNQLLQAVAAIRYADQQDLTLNFYINSARVEAGGNAILENIQSLFVGTPHMLIQNKWMPREELLKSLATIDLGMQVSLSETFSIVAADMVNVGIPVVVSNEVRWANELSKVKTTDIDSILDGMQRVLFFKTIGIFLNRHGLSAFDKNSKKVWLEFIDEQ